MKKNNLIEGAMIATISIVICKIIGILYVIPFYKIIGVQGGTLYSYAYSIYAVFLTLSSTGIPLAISKMISEYNSLEYYNIKERVYKIGSIIIIGIGFISFITLLLIAPMIAKLILGDLQGGNTVEGVTLVIRIVSSALLIVPLLSVTKGYLQGHRLFVFSSISEVLEQIIRVAVILVGSYVSIKIFNVKIETAVGISVFAATVAALSAYVYLISRMHKHRKLIKRNEPLTREESKITNKELFRKIIMYALPFILIDLIKSAYSLVDTVTVVRTLNDLGATALYAETTIGVISTWATKLNMIVISVALGLVISLIPNISSSYAKKDMNDINKKVNQSLQALIFITVPTVIGICFLAQPIWVIFYGYDALSIDIFRYFIFQALTFSIFTVVINIMQALNNGKVALLALFSSFIAKVILNIPAIYLCNKLNIPLYLGPIIVTLLTQTLAIIYLISVLKNKYQIQFKETIINIAKIILITGIMLLSLMIINLFLDFNTTNRLMAMLYTAIYGLIGIIIYAIATYKTHLLDIILGKKLINLILIKLHLKKKNIEE